MVGRTPENSGWQWPLDELWHCAKSMAEDGLLSSAELLRFTLPTSPRSREDLAAPFAAGPYMGLTLEHAAVIEAPDPFWEEYLETRNTARFGKQWAGMLRAITGPLAATAFASRPNAGALVDEFFQRLESRAAAEPRKNLHFAAVAVVRKTGSERQG
jgi:hypothetical protein